MYIWAVRAVPTIWRYPTWNDSTLSPPIPTIEVIRGGGWKPATNKGIMSPLLLTRYLQKKPENLVTSYIRWHSLVFKSNGNIGLTTEDLTAHKTGKACSYFHRCWLQDCFSHPSIWSRASARDQVFAIHSKSYSHFPYTYSVMFTKPNHKKHLQATRPWELQNISGSDSYCAYWELVFWIYTDLQCKERVPLPSCLVLKVRATFPPTEDEELFADWVFKGFVYGDLELPDAWFWWIIL